MSDLTLECVSVYRLCEQAQGLMDVKRSADAIPLLQQAIQREPDALRPRCLVALAFLNLRQHGRALQAADEAMRVDPTSEWPHRLRSISLRQKGNRRGALEAAQEAARRAPEEPLVLHCLASAELANGKKRRARETAEILVRLAPDESFSHQLLGEIASAERKWREAEGHFVEALEIDPQSWTAMNDLAIALQGQKKMKEAIERFHDAARLAPEQDLVRKNLSQSVRGYVGIGFFGVWIAFRLLTVVMRDGMLNDPAIAVLVLGVIVLLPVAYMVQRRQRLKHLHPQVVDFYQDEKRRDWARLRHKLPAKTALFLGSITTATWTFIWLLDGPMSAGFHSGWLAAYLLVAGGTLTGLVPVLRSHWRSRRKRE